VTIGDGWFGGRRFFTVAVLAAACRSGQAARTATDRAGEEATARPGVELAIDSNSAAAERGDVDAMLRGLADDYVLRRADGIVRGRDAMRPVFEENFRGYVYEQQRITIERFAASGSLAVTSGTIRARLRPKDRPQPAPTETFVLPYLADWRRLPEGRWVLRDLAVIYPPG
jgi:ketosteroid isomerase-like protein